MKTPVLVTIPTSTYCEKARWALVRAGVSFVERGHLPFFSRLATWGRGRWSSVPLLKTEGEVLGDSSDILRWADERAVPARRLFPEDAAARRAVEELEERFDEGLGKASRILVLSHVLPVRKLVMTVARRGVPLVEWLGLAVSLPLARAGIRRMYGINPESVIESRRRCDEELAFASARLADGRRYLTGDRFTAADLTFAALAGPLVLPDDVPGIPPYDGMPPEGRADVDRYRATAAGAFVLRLYREDRAS
jgi:glutathione S-transferase